MSQPYGLIADVGGTNIRLALVDEKGVEYTQLKKYLCAQYPSITAVIKQYLADVNAEVAHACIAIACPTDSDWIDMTNNSWAFSRREVEEELGLDALYLINDYTAISMSLPFLTDEQLIQVGAGDIEPGAPKAVLGPGTGLGVAHLTKVDGYWHSLPGEGGHVDFAPIDEIDLYIWKYLHKRYNHISYEQVLSGLGIIQIYEAITEMEGLTLTEKTAAEITQQGISGECEISKKAVEQFCKILGSHAGNLAMNLGAFGGVYVAGGIVPRFPEFVKNSDFRERFEAKGRFRDYVRRVPSFLIIEEQPGLIGAAAFLMQQ
ncbi:glucokinase [Echinimonas agarilytica]|uniref:Glucokinase n=1 Tax=Echinimonas agarilytica TaxID=1215918 RepID=A0AA42B7K0_9GAMM|nr:glucokinase [Echinimonas agarilytica]MCM2679463.1 glucokinase [Echinimonas agarilytica]